MIKRINHILPYIIGLLITTSSSGQIINTIVGNGTQGYGGNGGLALSAQLYSPRTIGFDQNGNLYIGDQCELRMVNIGDTINVIAGQPSCGYTGDNGPATSATLNGIIGTAFDISGSIYVSDVSNGVIRKVNNVDTISTFCSTGSMSSIVDHNGLLLCVGTAGNIYATNSTSCSYTVIVGNGTPGFSGDNGPALAAQINGVYGIAFDANGNLYFTDTNNSRVRKVDALSGIITTIAGDGTQGYGGDNGPAINAQLNTPLGIAVDQYGDVFVADRWNHRIRKIDTNGIITTVAGTGNPSFSGDGGPAIQAELNQPYDVAILGNDLYISDWVNFRIRKVDNTVGITSSKEQDVRMSVYPNPNTGAFSLQYYLQENGIFEITDMAGKLLCKYELPSGYKEVKVANNGLRNGFYLYRVISNGHIIKTGKIAILE